MAHRTLPFTSTGLALALVLAGAVSAEPDARSRDFDRFLATAVEFESKLASDPDSYEFNLGAASNLNIAMAVRTNGNLTLFDGLQDSDENRAVWSEYSERALKHARASLRLRPDSGEAAAAVATSYMFYSSSLGILRAILKGAGSEFGENARRVKALDPSYDDGFSDYMLAGFYLVAPWPIRDMDDALVHYEKAVEIGPTSLRNRYGLGVYWSREGDNERARRDFERSLAMPCDNDFDRLFCDFMKSESRRALAKLAGG
jgi:tetratricopeptide (TPR) repeat protein